MSIASQAANEVIYATSATQLARSANLTFNGTDLTVGAGDAYLGTNNKYLYGKQTGGLSKKLIGMNASDEVAIAGDGQNTRMSGTVFVDAKDVIISATNKLRLDGSATGDTYLSEASANVIAFTAGGTTTTTITSTGIIPNASATYNLGADGTTWNRLFLAAGSVGDPSISLGDEDTGWYSTGAGGISAALNGTHAFIVSRATLSGLTLLSTANGTGAVGGNQIKVGRNTSGNGAAGAIIYTDIDGTEWGTWVDDTGDLRIASALSLPEEDGTPSDTSGTVVGDQTSWHEVKHVLRQRTDTNTALAAVLNTPVYDFTYKGRGYLAPDGSPAVFTGLVIYDKTEWFAKNLGAQQVPALNEINVAGYHTLAIQALHDRIANIEQRIQ